MPTSSELNQMAHKYLRATDEAIEADVDLLEELQAMATSLGSDPFYDQYATLTEGRFESLKVDGDPISRWEFFEDVRTISSQTLRDNADL